MRCVVAVPGGDIRQHAVVVGIQVEPLLGGITRDMRQEKPGRNEERLILGRGLDLSDRPACHLVIPLAAVIVVQRPHAPVHQRIVTHRCGTHEFPRRSGADTAIGRGDLELGRGVGIITARGGAAVVDLARRRGAIAMGGEILRQRDAVLQAGHRARCRGKPVNARR